MSMAETWQGLEEKFATLTLREKLIIAFASVFLVVYLIYMLLITPQLESLDAIKKSRTQAMTSLASTNVQIDEITAALKVDPNKKAKEEIAALQQKLAKVESDLNRAMTDYVAPEKMTRELTELLNTSANIRVIGMEVIAAEQIEQTLDASFPSYYRHQFKLTVTGSYFHLMNFVRKVTEKNKEFGIQDLTYVVKEYPKAELTLTLMTISDNKNVIRL